MNAPCNELTASQLAARGLGVLEEKESAELDSHLAACACCSVLKPSVGAALSSLALGDEPAPDVWRGIERELDRRDAAPPQVALTCTYCRDQLVRDRSVFCAACLAPHHEECFLEHGRCAACRERRLVHPSAPVRPRWHRRAVPLVALLLGAGAAAALLPSRPGSVAPSAPPTPPRAARATTPEPSIKLDFDDARLGAVLQHLSGARPGHLALTDMPDTRVTIHFQGAWLGSLEAVARVASASLLRLEQQRWLIHREPRVTLAVKEWSLDAIAYRLSKDSGRQVVIGAAPEQKLTFDFRDMPWTVAVGKVAAAAGLVARRSGDLIVVAPHAFPWGSPDLEQSEASAWTVSDVGSTTAVVTRARPTSRMRVRAHGLAPDTWAELFAAIGARSVVTPAGLTARIVLDVRDVPWHDAFVAGLGAYGLGVSDAEDRCLTVCTLPRPSLQPLRWGFAPNPAAPGSPTEHDTNGYADMPLLAIAIDRDGAMVPRAVLAGSVVAPGDTIGRRGRTVRVVAIRDDEVELERLDSGHRFLLGLGGDARPFRLPEGPPLLDADFERACRDIIARHDELAALIRRRGPFARAFVDLARLIGRTERRAPSRQKAASAWWFRSNLAQVGDIKNDDFQKNMNQVRIACDLEEARLHLQAGRRDEARELLRDARDAVERLEEIEARAGLEHLPAIRALEAEAR